MPIGMLSSAPERDEEYAHAVYVLDYTTTHTFSRLGFPLKG